ncbi:hypothetical protein IGI04_007641 [Brassica rapa subsp. trilocularis]|uniref:Uncharacterized protein n=1 Tax=Brassica rapa subsp. trilocularis TaxID=1813537 RepID=A0ABQ7NKD7_BRACM|nr:hypothetical protein IGI04_007641 [Brassica rapa subsp. trilocularis]
MSTTNQKISTLNQFVYLRLPDQICNRNAESQPNRRYERDEVLVIVHADHTYELFSQPISQAQTISPLQHTSWSRRNTEEADSDDCGEKIGGLEEGQQWQLLRRLRIRVLQY